MPCYNDVPDDGDQAEIEGGEKERMYFNACGLLTKEQVSNNKIKLTRCPDENTALCNLCKVLTKEQMQKVTDYYYLIKWPYKTLYDW